MKTITVSLVEGPAQAVKFEFPSSASVEEVWEAIKGLRAEDSRPEPRPGRRYGNISYYFSNLEVQQVEVSFADFAQLLGSDLPASAYDHRAWWANDPNRSQGKAWMAAGWRVKEVSMTEEKVVFERAA